MTIIYRSLMAVVLTAVLYVVVHTAALQQFHAVAIVLVIFSAVFVSPLLGQLPAHLPPAPGRKRGTVKWFNTNKGFGFITQENGDELFVHYRSIRGQGRRILQQDQKVEFTIIDGSKGPQADDVEVIG